jgi:hypothetical protein
VLRYKSKTALLGASAVTGLVLVAVASFAPTGAAKSGSRSRSRETAVAAALAKHSVRATPAAGKVLGGFTSQHVPVVLAIAKKDKRADIVGSVLNMTCTSGDQFFVPDGWVKLPISHAGAVKGAITIPASPGGTGSVTGGTDTISGTLNAKKATFSGRWEMHVSFSTSTGRDDQCDSGQVTFRAVL